MVPLNNRPGIAYCYLWLSIAKSLTYCYNRLRTFLSAGRGQKLIYRQKFDAISKIDALFPVLVVIYCHFRLCIYCCRNRLCSDCPPSFSAVVDNPGFAYGIFSTLYFFRLSGTMLHLHRRQS